MESRHNRKDIFNRYCHDVMAIRAAHRKFDFVAEYLPVFVCIHICGPDHFRRKSYMKRELRLVFNSLNLSSYDTILESVNNLKIPAIKNALFDVCNLELMQVIFGENQVEVDDFVSLQVKNMESLYSKINFREHMLTLYKFFIRKFMDDFK